MESHAKALGKVGSENPVGSSEQIRYETAELPLGWYSSGVATERGAQRQERAAAQIKRVLEPLWVFVSQNPASPYLPREKSKIHSFDSS